MWVFICNSILLGVGLAMDAFSVSLANGLAEPKMPFGKMVGVSGVYAVFQWAMPMIGWFFVHNLVRFFKVFEKFIPWIALLLLLYIGGKMILEGLEERKADEEELAENNRSHSAKLRIIEKLMPEPPSPTAI